MKQNRKFFILFLFTSLLSTLVHFSCRNIGGGQQDSELATYVADKDFYKKRVQPILDKRCVSCHACYDAPCQLKLSSWEGLDRGANKIAPYEYMGITPLKPTRLFVDRKTTKEWQKHDDFWPILPKLDKHTQTIDLKNSSFHRMLKLKEKHPRVKTKYDVITSRTCPAPPNEILRRIQRDVAEVTPFEPTDVVGQLPAYEQHMSWAGMPYGLPPLSKTEQKTLGEWIQRGAPAPKAANDNPARQDLSSVKKWEKFLNQRSDLKHRLTARYLYEHLYIAHIYFKHNSKNFYRLVRSRTPSGTTVDEIATRRPYNDPGKKFFYRFRRITSTIVNKTHITYKLDPSRLKRYQELFIASRWNVIPRSPNYNRYDYRVASNPFDSFAEIPESSRYQFFLDEARYMVMTFIRGPVCRGQQAVNVINDQFWVIFLDPKFDPSVRRRNFLYNRRELLKLPSIDSPFWNSLKSAFYDLSFPTQVNEFSRQFYQVFNEQHDLRNRSYQVRDLWDGDNTNNNALLTVHRSNESASVSQGLLGDTPKTVWVLNYSNFETIYYNLVASFDMFGNVSSKLNTRVFMESSRTFGEDLFLNLVPRDQRLKTRSLWSRDKNLGKGIAASKNKRFSFYPTGSSPLKAISSAKLISHEENRKQTNKIMKQYLSRLSKTVIGRGNGFDDLNCVSCIAQRKTALNGLDDVENQLRKFHLSGSILDGFPETSFMRVTKGNKVMAWYTIMKNTTHYNVASLFDEQDRIDSKNQSLEFHRGFIGSYPNLFFSVDVGSMDEFLRDLKAPSKPAGHVLGAKKTLSRALQSRFAIGRFHRDFWEISDQAFIGFKNPKLGGIGYKAGRFDLGRYMNLYN